MLFVRWSVLFGCGLLFMACTPQHFGVNEAVWRELSEEQRNEVIAQWNARERIRAETERESERRRTLQAEREAEQARERAREREANAEAIRQGTAGHFGDLIRVSLQGGEMKLGGKHRRFAAESLSLANGEVREIEVVSTDHKYLQYRTSLFLRYEDGVLALEAGGRGKEEARLVFEPEWRRGKQYRVDSHGALQLRDVQVSVMILPLREGRH